MNRIEIRVKQKSWAERHPIRSAVLYTTLTIGFIIFIATGGIALVTQLAGFIENTKDTPSSKKEDIILTPPHFDALQQVTNKKTYTLSGTASSGSTVRIFINGKPNDYVVTSTGRFSTEANLNEGVNTVKAVTVDQSGKTSRETDIYTISVDTKLPTLSIDNPKDGDHFTGKKYQLVTINGSVDESSKLTVNDRIIIVSSNGSFSYNYNLSEGDNALNFKAVDAAGNETLQTLNITFSF